MSVRLHICSGRSEIFKFFSALGLFDMRLANKAYYTQSWGVLGVSGAQSSENSVRIN